MFKLPGTSNLQEWNRQVLQLGLGDTTNQGVEERRLKKEGEEYNLYINNGTENVLVNNIFSGIKKPRVYLYSKYSIGINGTTITFSQAFASLPIPVATPLNGPQYVQINTITTTSIKVYLYNSSGALISGQVHLIVAGERSV